MNHTVAQLEFSKMFKQACLCLVLIFISFNLFAKAQNKNIIIVSLGDINQKKFQEKYKEKFYSLIGDGFYFKNAYSPDNWSIFYDWFNPLPSGKLYSSNGTFRREDDYLKMFVPLWGFSNDELKALDKKYDDSKNYIVFIQNNFLVPPYLRRDVESKLLLDNKHLEDIKKHKANFKAKKFNYLNSLLFAEGIDAFSVRDFDPDSKEKFFQGKNFQNEKKLVEDIYDKKMEILFSQFEVFWKNVLAERKKDSLIVIVGNHGEPIFEHGNIHVSNDLYNTDFKIEMIVIPPGHVGKINVDKSVTSLILNKIIFDFIKDVKIDSSYLKQLDAKDIFLRSCDKRKIALISQDRKKIIYDLQQNDFKYYDLERDPEELNPISDVPPADKLKDLRNFDFDEYFKNKKFKRESCQP